GNAAPAIQLPHQAGTPDRVGQGTAIEQSRAAAEVYASVLAAKQAPRDPQRAAAEMASTCGMSALAERAFFSFNRGGQTVAGPTVQLARELARCWGNIQYGVAELRRDDEHGQSEMQAFAWDMESNARVSAVFIVPHIRDTKQGPKKLTDMRDIYESNANAGARRVREAIFSVLPLWFVEDAKERCQKTLEHGGGVPLVQRIAQVIEWYQKIGVTRAQLVAHVGRRPEDWSELDLAPLGVTYRTIKRGEATVAEMFPTAPVTADEVTSAAAAKTTAKATTQPPAEQPADAPAGDDTDALWQQILAFSPADWDTERVEQDFAGVTKVAHDKADAATLRRYLDRLQGN
ncbi:MAG TPA: hypothetical protein VKA83_22295, partial [Methylomirabilota bacterium]|nr:hypothetical protein [Methylomirabilota bacterium]